MEFLGGNCQKRSPGVVKKRLSRQEMAQQLREEAAELLRIADELDAAVRTESTSSPEPSKNLLDQVIRHMGGKAFRKSVVARQLGVAESKLDKIMTSQNGFSVTRKGWWQHR
jgi:hypothetical protein